MATFLRGFILIIFNPRSFNSGCQYDLNMMNPLKNVAKAGKYFIAAPQSSTLDHSFMIKRDISNV